MRWEKRAASAPTDQRPVFVVDGASSEAWSRETWARQRRRRRTADGERRFNDDIWKKRPKGPDNRPRRAASCVAGRYNARQKRRVAALTTRGGLAIVQSTACV